jgi:hypothetical protein
MYLQPGTGRPICPTFILNPDPCRGPCELGKVLHSCLDSRTCGRLQEPRASNGPSQWRTEQHVMTWLACASADGRGQVQRSVRTSARACADKQCRRLTKLLYERHSHLTF